ncbi:MAG: type III-A CRISPR-associated RAMP protein Csm4 [Spirulina sp.]
MSNWKLIRLNFGRNIAHFGEIGIGLEETSERVRSDTLFSALISVYARLYGKDDVEQLLADFNQKPEPPFCHSSTFIYRYLQDKQNKGNYIYYLPKPLAFPNKYPIGDDLAFTKVYKKLNYLPLKIWKRWYQGDGFKESDRRELEAQSKKDKTDKIEGSLEKAGVFSYGETYKTARHPKVAIDRMTSATNFYHTGFVQFEHKIQSHSGLYFLLYFPENDPELEQKLQAVLKLLADEGLGGERSSGAGLFTLEWLELHPDWQKIINFSAPNASYTLLSLLWDKPENLQDEINNDLTRYNVIPRGGWISSSPSGFQKRRKKVRMFAEGSVFPFKPKGRLADVTPLDFKGGHQVYRSGISLSLPIIVNSSEN